MKYKRIMAATAVIGMLAVTGCSANTPERNHGNRNGERVSAAVNRNYGERTTRNSRYTRTANRNNTFARPGNRVSNTFQRGTTNRYEMNRTDRGVPRSGMNRAARRANSNYAGRRMDGVTLANSETTPVFFNKKAPETAPEQAPAPSTTPEAIS